MTGDKVADAVRAERTTVPDNRSAIVENAWTTTPQRRQQQQQQLRAGTFGDQDGQGPRPGDCGQDRQSQRRGEDIGAKGQENGTAGQVRWYLIITDSKYSN